MASAGKADSPARKMVKARERGVRAMMSLETALDARRFAALSDGRSHSLARTAHASLAGTPCAAQPERTKAAPGASTSRNARRRHGFCDERRFEIRHPSEIAFNFEETKVFGDGDPFVRHPAAVLAGTHCMFSLRRKSQRAPCLLTASPIGRGSKRQLPTVILHACLCGPERCNNSLVRGWGPPKPPVRLMTSCWALCAGGSICWR